MKKEEKRKWYTQEQNQTDKRKGLQIIRERDEKEGKEGRQG